MSQAGTTEDALAGWDPRRRAALELVWAQFRRAGAQGADLSGELVAERRREAGAAADQPG